MKKINQYSKIFAVGVLILAVTISSLNCRKNQNASPDEPQSDDLVSGIVITPDSIYQKIPSAPEAPATGLLPTSFFLEIPSSPIQQGNKQGACGGIACAQLKSILDHTKLGIPYSSSGIIYSPSYLFNQTHSGTNECITGSQLYRNLDIIQEQGICKIEDFLYEATNEIGCLTTVTQTARNKASSNKISFYYKIEPKTVEKVKQFINAGFPVVVSYCIDDNFEFCKGEYIWKKLAGLDRGLHAGTIYGWDDSKNALKMLNPWGAYKGWGSNGSIWIDYTFFEDGYSAYRKKKVFMEAYVAFNPHVTAKPTADFEVSGMTSITAGHTVSFKDKSSNNPTSWNWSFPGGSPNSSTDKNPIVAYNSPGTYNVTLTAGNSSGSDSKTATGYIVVTAGSALAPQTDFLATTTTTIPVGGSVSFVDKSTNSPTAWSWSFPGGSPNNSNFQNPTVTYNVPGDYGVTLQASNSHGSNEKTRIAYIHVGSSISAPIADFGVTGITTISAGGTVSFVDHSINSPTSWTWSMPGSSAPLSTVPNPVVAYASPGVYDVTLSVSNAYGSNSLTKHGYITVTSGSSWTCGMSFTDSRDGRVYNTISIGGQCWMTQDLQYASPSSLSYVGTRYYQFTDALTVAPSGWHLPTDLEWQQLEMSLGMSSFDASSMGTRGTDQGVRMAVGGSSGLNLTYTGNFYFDGTSNVLAGYGTNGNYWTSNYYDATNGYLRAIYTYNPRVGRLISYYTGNYYPVRCIKN